MNILPKSKSPAVAILVALAILMSALAIRMNAAGIIYTSYGPTDGFSPNNGIAIQGSTVHFGYFAVAAKFQVTQDASLDSIQVPMFFTSGVDSFIINLCSENSGYPGQALESFTVSASPGPSGTVVTATSQAHPVLTTSQDYWLEVLPEDPTTRGAWCDFSTHYGSVSGRIMTDSGSGFNYTTYPPLPFAVMGEVPEPSIGCLSLLAFALALVKVKGRYHKVQSRATAQ